MACLLTIPTTILNAEVTGDPQGNQMSFRRLSRLALPFAGLLMGAAGCVGPQLPNCVQGKAPEAFADKPAAGSIQVAIDGSGSMLGLTGSPQARNAWKALLKGVSNASSLGVPIKAMRSGSGQLQALANINEAGDICFFAGCGSYSAVSSSLDTLWKKKIVKDKPPMNLVISDLEINNGEIDGLVTTIKPHIQKGGGVIGVLAVRLPFMGNVYNSQAAVIHKGPSERPIYLLATGPRTQLHDFLTEVQRQASAEGVPADDMRLTFLDDQVSRPTLTAKAVRGNKNQATVDMDVSIGGKAYGWTNNPEYRFIRLPKQEDEILLGSETVPATNPQGMNKRVLVTIEPITTPGTLQARTSAVYAKGIKLQEQMLLMSLAIPPASMNGAIRAIIPRGRLPEDWWIGWNRNDPASPDAKNQTDGLLPLLSNLGSLLVKPGSSPAVAFCLAYNRISQ
jgi:hypothetical protein